MSQLARWRFVNFSGADSTLVIGLLEFKTMIPNFYIFYPLDIKAID